MEPKKLEWSFFVGPCLAAIAMNEILCVLCTRYAGMLASVKVGPGPPASLWSLEAGSRESREPGSSRETAG